MTPISPKNNAWIDAYDGPLFDYVVARIQQLSEPLGVYPFVFAFRRGPVTRTFAFSSRGYSIERSETFARAACVAFDPDEAVFSYGSKVLESEPEIQDLFVRCAKGANPRLTILQLEPTATGWMPVASFGDAPNADKFDFMFKDAAEQFYLDQSARRADARSVLMEWMPEVAWQFDLGFGDTQH